MKHLLLVFSLLYSTAVSASEPEEPAFDQKVYTPEVVVDRQNLGAKGAVQLLWQKPPKPTRFEVEVSNGKTVYSQVGEKNFHHLMLYFDKSYQWRVREVSAARATQFSPWRPLRVVRGDERHVAQDHNESHENQSEIDEILLDTGE